MEGFKRLGYCFTSFHCHCAGFRMSDLGEVFADPRDGSNQPRESEDGDQEHGDLHAQGQELG